MAGKDQRRSRTISIRTSLLRTLVILIVAISVTVLTVMFTGARQAIRGLSEQLIDRASGQAEEGMRNFFRSIERLVSVSRAWSDAGLLDYENKGDLDQLNAVFAPVLTENPHITSLMVTDDTGFAYLLLRDFGNDQPYGWLNRITWADRGPDAAYVTTREDDLTLISEEPFADAADYDVRERPYYTLPDIGETIWTDPYYFYITRDAGMTVSAKWKHSSGQVRVAAVDLLLLELSHFTVSRRPTPNGKVFVMSGDGSLLGLPADERWSDDASQRKALRNPEEQDGKETKADREAVLMTAEELELPVVAAAVKRWRSEESDSDEHFRFQAGGEVWWGGFRKFQLNGPELWIGVIAPETDFLGTAKRQQLIVLAICGAALVVAVVIAFFMANRYSRPLEALALQTEKVRNLNLSSDIPVQSRVREISQLAEANAQMMAALESFAKYVPLDLVRQLLHRGEVAKIGGKTKTLTILFTDIQGFTNLAEGMAPSDLTLHMADYFSAMLEILNDEAATVDKFIGDAIVAFWGAPQPNEEHALHGVRSVLRCRDLLRERNAEWERQGLPQLKTRFGLSTGEAVVGNVGSPERLNHTVLGDTVNLASRLEALNARYGTEILAAETVVEAGGDGFIWREIDRVVVKGKEQAIAIFEPLCETAAATGEMKELKRCYEDAFARYVAGDFSEAISILVTLLEDRPDDGPSLLLLERCRELVRQPPGDDWDGVVRFTTK